jgi:hypothetical protein
MSAPVHPYGDYGVALRTLRSGRNFLGYVLFFSVMLQVVGFLLMRFTTQPYRAGQPVAMIQRVEHSASRRAEGAGNYAVMHSGIPAHLNVLPDASSVGQAIENYQSDRLLLGEQAGRRLNLRRQWRESYYLIAPVAQLLGLLASGSQAIIIFVTLLVILVGQAPGVAHMTRSLIWSVILLFMVFPWQYVLPGFPIPGVLYGWHELHNTLALSFLPPPGHGISFDQRILIVGRYVLWPVLALVVMLVTAERFRAGVRLAIGHPLQSMMLGDHRGPSPTGQRSSSSPAAPATTINPRP